jgi:hypothetical protein
MLYMPKMMWYFDGNNLVWVVSIGGKVYAKDSNLETAKQWAKQKWEQEQN